MKKKTFAAALSAAAVVGLMSAFPAMAQGWTREGSRWKWYNAKGEYASQVWKKGEDGLDRYLDESGFMLSDSWVVTGGDAYYVDEEGRKLQNTWAKLPPREQVKGSGDLAEFWYYFGSTGKMADDRFITTDGVQYYVGPDGKRQSGWLKDGLYCTDESGAILTGWQEIEEADGETAQYYFGPNGKKTRASGESAYRVREIDGEDYCFDRDGVMQTGWVNVAETAEGAGDADGAGTLQSGARAADGSTSADTPDWRYYDDDGAAASGLVTFILPGGEKEAYYFSRNGAGYTGVRDGCLYCGGLRQTASSKTGYRVVSVPEEKYVNYLVDSRGNVVKKGKVKSANGVRYVTDAAGRVLTVNGSPAQGKRYSLPVLPDYGE